MDDPAMRGPSLAAMTRNERFAEALRKIIHVYKHIIQNQGWTPLSPEIKHLGRYSRNVWCSGLDIVFKWPRKSCVASFLDLLLQSSKTLFCRYGFLCI